MRIRDKK